MFLKDKNGAWASKCQQSNMCSTYPRRDWRNSWTTNVVFHSRWNNTGKKMIIPAFWWNCHSTKLVNDHFLSQFHVGMLVSKEWPLHSKEHLPRNPPLISKLPFLLPRFLNKLKLTVSFKKPIKSINFTQSQVKARETAQLNAVSLVKLILLKIHSVILTLNEFVIHFSTFPWVIIWLNDENGRSMKKWNQVEKSSDDSILKNRKPLKWTFFLFEVTIF